MTKTASFGICALCEGRVSKGAMARHLAVCTADHDRRAGAAAELFHLRIEGKETSVFWIDLEIKGESPFGG
jgi:hypothetical protein